MDIRTEQLIIRNFILEDWKALKWIWEDFNRTEFAQYDRPHVFTDEELEKITSEAVNNDRYHAVCYNHHMIGYIRFKNRDPLGCEFGYCFHSESHRKGFAREALFALMDYYRKEYNIQVFTAGTGLKNTPSVSFLEACGFELVKVEQVSFYKDENGKDIYFDGGVFVKTAVEQ